MPNRYFGVFKNEEIKTRGIEVRRHDTPAFIRDTQTELLDILAKSPNGEGLKSCIPQIRMIVREKREALRSGLVPPEKLIVRQTVSRNMEDYSSPVPAFSALQALADAGKTLRPGQTVRLIYTRGFPRAGAWDAVADFDERTINIPCYSSLLDRAVETVVEPITGSDSSWLTQTKQLTLIS